MKKLELKNLKVVKPSKDEKLKINGGKVQEYGISVQCNQASVWSIDCGFLCPHCN